MHATAKITNYRENNRNYKCYSWYNPKTFYVTATTSMLQAYFIIVGGMCHLAICLHAQETWQSPIIANPSSCSMKYNKTGGKICGKRH